MPADPFPLNSTVVGYRSKKTDRWDLGGRVRDFGAGFRVSGKRAWIPGPGDPCGYLTCLTDAVRL